MKKLLLVFLMSLVVLLSGCVAADDENQLVVGIECAYAPFDWTTSEANDYTVQIADSDLYCDGYDVVVAQHIADELGMELVVKKIEWDGLIPALQTDVIDLILSAMSPTEERKESVLFTDAYYAVNTVMVVKADGSYASATSLSDFSGAAVVAQINTIQDGAIDQITGVNHVAPMAQTSDLVVSVQNDVNDALVTEYPVAQAIVEANPDLSIVVFDGDNGFVLDESEVTVAIAVRLGETDLAESINAALATIDQDTRDAWMDAASNRQPSGE